MITRRELTTSAICIAGSMALPTTLVAETAETTAPMLAFPSKIKSRFATNRAYVGSPEFFGSNFRDTSDGQLYVSGTIEVNKIGIPSHWEPDPTTIKPFPAPKTNSLADIVSDTDTSPDAISDFLKAVDGNKATVATDLSKSGLVFIHGYAFSFLDTFEVVGQIAEGYANTDVLSFCWPSFGDHLQYIEDQDHAYRSGAAVALFLTKLLSQLAKRSPSDPPINLVVHSMGNRVLSSAVQILAGSVPHLLTPAKPYFEHVFHMAADEDYQGFDEAVKLKPLLALAKNVNVYTNASDGALLLSEFVNHTGALGAYGPATFPLGASVFWLECDGVAAVSDWDGSATYGHQYFRLSPQVMRDVRLVIKGVDPYSLPTRVSFDPTNPKSQKFRIIPA